MKSNIARLIGLLVALLAIILPAVSQEMMRTRTYSIHDGLPSNYVSQIAQDPQGVIWISTWNGLAAYDGYRFVNFRDRQGILASNRIYWMEPAGDGYVWVLTYDKRPFVLDSRTGVYHDIGRVTGYNTPARAISAHDNTAWVLGDSVAVRVTVNGDADKDEIKIQCETLRARVRHVMRDSDGCEWLYTDKGLVRHGADISIHDTFVALAELPDDIYQITKRGAIYAGHTPRRVAEIPGVKAATAMIAYGKNMLICATDVGVYAYHTASKRLTRLDVSSLNGSDGPNSPKGLNGVNGLIGTIEELHTDGSGRLWAIVKSEEAGGLRHVVMARSVSDAFVPVEFTADVAGQTEIDRNLWIEDTYGRVWIAVKDGALGYYDEDSGVLRGHAVRSRLLGNSVIPRVEVSFVDRQNNLWLSSMHNVTLVNFTNSNLKSVPLCDNQSTRSVAIGGDGSIWAGAADGTLGRYTPDGRMISTEKFSDRIYALKADRHGNMWMGTKGEGLYRISPDGAVAQLRHAESDAASIPSDNIYDIDIAPDGNIWLATYGGGVAMIASAEATAQKPAVVSRTSGFAIPDGDKYTKVRRITHTPDGVMVASTTAGLLTFDSREADPRRVRFYRTEHVDGDERSLSTSHVMSALAASDGTVYVAPLGDKICRVDAPAGDRAALLRDGLRMAPLSDGQLHPFVDDPARAGNVVSMAEGRDGTIYIVLESCVVIYSPREGTAMSVGFNDFDRMIEFTEAQAAVDAEGRLWAPTAGGLIAVDGTRAAPANYVPDIVVSGINSEPGGGMPSINPREIVVAAGERSISLSFAALDYSNNELIQYAYRLDDADDWIYIGNTNTLNLGGLTPGRHVLEVRSTNGDGIWVDNARRVEIYVTPRFWESVPGRIVMLLVVCAVAALIYIMYRRHRRTRAEHRKMHDFIIGYVDDKGRDQGGQAASLQSDNEADDEQPDADRRMLSRLTEYIEAHLSNENLKVEDMAAAVGMGRTAFYNRLKALVDMTPADFVRRLRIQRAQVLLKEGKLTVAEVAYAVGYADPKYFTRIFKKDTGKTPSEARGSYADMRASASRTGEISPGTRAPGLERE